MAEQRVHCLKQEVTRHLDRVTAAETEEERLTAWRCALDAQMAYLLARVEQVAS